MRNGELGTKHVFAGETRVVSKLVKTPNTVTVNNTTTTSTLISSSTSTLIPGSQGLDNGRGKKLGIIRRLPDGYQTGINPPVEKDEFFYHGDHLGSSNMITDAYGAVYQHLEYFPYGESWIEEGGSYGGNTPGYKFTSKELDPETGLYYYGARYYDPVLNRWVSADPILGKYLPTGDKEKDKKLPGFGGVFTPMNLNLYTYSQQNPIKYLDPDGNFTMGGTFEGKAAAGSPVGNRDVGALATGSYTAALAWDPAGRTLYATDFLSYGTYAGTRFDREGVYGAYAGGGLNLFISNAKIPSRDLKGTVPTFAFNLDIGLRTLNVEYGKDEKGIWVLSVGIPGAGAGKGVAVSNVNITTTAVSETPIATFSTPQTQSIDPSALKLNSPDMSQYLGGSDFGASNANLNQKMPDPTVMNCHASE